jgi:hypothetical protein
VFATHGEEDEIYPLTIIEIAEAQKRDQNLKIYYKRNAKTPEKGMSFQLIVYIKGIHNTVADAISRLEYDPSVNKTAESYLITKVKGNSRSVQRQNWLTLSKH